MKNLDKISFPYRASSHLALLHVISESGSWEKYGLDVNYDYQISSGDAHRLVPKGEVEFVGGNHVSTYGHRARGDNWVYLGQTMNFVYPKLVVGAESGINSLSDLRGKVVGTGGTHPSLNDWLLLKQRGLDCDRDQVHFVSKIKARHGSMDPVDPVKKAKAPALWEQVLNGEIDAALLMPPASLFAEAAGLKVIDIDPLPMIWFTTISSSLDFVEKHPDVVERFLKAMIEGVHYFKTQPDKSIEILRKRYLREGQMSQSQAAYTYQIMVDVLEPKLYPTMAAITNVYEEAKRHDPDANKISPMALWDLHHIRKIDDSGFVNQLYSSTPPKPNKDAADPEYLREKAAIQAKVLADVKACGHPIGMQCDCDD